MSLKKWLILLAISLGVFMSLLDVTVVNVALPAIQQDFGGYFGVIQWILNGYTIAFAIALLIMSNLGDRYGKKRMFMVSLLIFCLSSLANALAPNIQLLIVSRVIQGIGGAGLMSLAMALVATIFEGKMRAFAISIVGSVIGFATASGPLFGGMLIDAFGWQSIFLINLPIGLISLVSVWKLLAETKTFQNEERIDFAGMLLSIIFLFSAVFGLIQKEENLNLSWLDGKILVWLILALVAFVLFVFVERKVKNPLVDFALLKDKHLVGVLLVAFILGFSIYSYSTFLTILMQNYLGWSPFKTGVNQLYNSVWSLILGPVTAVIGKKFQKKFVTAFGMLLAIAGFILMTMNLSLNMTIMALIPTMVLMGLCNALVNPMINTSAMEYIEMRHIGTVSGLINVARQLGTSFGIVVLGLVQSSAFNHYINHHDEKVPEKVVSGLQNAGPFVGKIFTEQLHLPQNMVDLSVNAFNYAFTQINLVVMAGALLAVIVPLVLIKKNRD